ncbi:replication initiator protein A [Lentilactobacillus hilgardii]|uniref:replication initiator protein A n=1 Tax=Lentilactobacillus hilgardii TaxID=1588 RepID=UPI0021C3530A|nr:replication initiator protein A [Lentilactobacillus hilgardii]MCP9334518.1 replication initiator protein A [Lentilactobacillus hilgardii]MCP9350898.1 replication initiator protein A [Lentilactobacillus hilgardii]MCP9353790.1 replication initiator protein A [Lentilactobacillus hilgardii]
MTQFNFIQSQNAYGTKFFQLPQVLLYGEKYKELSDSAKLGYVVLRDRLEYSLQNNWIDDENRVYFIFTNHELQNLFGWSDQKISKVKKELEEAGLLFQINQGFDPKKKKNLPNRLYLADLEVTAKDVYIKQDFANKTAGTLDTSGLAQMRHNLYNTNNLDTNRYNIDTQKLDFSTAHFSPTEIQKQNQDLINHANDFLTDEDSGLPVFLEPEAVQLLSFWCRTPQQMRRFIGIILNAKYRVEKDHKDIGVIIPLDDEELKPLMTKALRRYFNALRSNEKHIKNVENYLYGTMQNLFGVWWNKQAAREYAAKHPEEQNTDNERSWN